MKGWYTTIPLLALILLTTGAPRTSLKGTTVFNLAELSTTCPETPRCGIFEESIKKPYPPDCNKYIMCSLGVTMVQSCPVNQHFSPSILTCMSPELASCTLCDLEESTTCPETPRCGIFEEGVKKPYPPDCNKYIMCSLGVAMVQSCPVNQHFSPSILTCMSPELASCVLCDLEESTTTDSGTTIGYCPETPTCSELETGMTKPYPPECTRYIYCNDQGEGEIRFCPRLNPDEKHYSEALGRCTSVALAKCPLCETVTGYLT